MIKTISHGVVLIAIIPFAACAAPPNPIATGDQDLPAQVAAALPDDIPSASVIRGPNGCYAYTYAHELIAITDSQGRQICLPATT